MSLPTTVATHGGGVCGRRHWASWGYWDHGEQRMVYEQMMGSGSVNRSIHIEVVLTQDQCLPHRLQLLKLLGYALTEVFVNDNSRNTLFVFTRVKKRLSSAEMAKKIKWDGMILTPELSGTLPDLVLPADTGSSNPFGAKVDSLVAKVVRTPLQKAILENKKLQEYVQSLLALRDAIAKLPAFYGNYYGGEIGYIGFVGGENSVYLETMTPDFLTCACVPFPSKVDDDFVLNHIFQVSPANKFVVANLMVLAGNQKIIQNGMSRHSPVYCSRFVDKLTSSGRPSTKAERMTSFEALVSNCNKLRDQANTEMRKLVATHGVSSPKNFLARLTNMTPQVHG